MPAKYTPLSPPIPRSGPLRSEDLIPLIEWLTSELRRLSDSINQVTDGHLERTIEEPQNPNADFIRRTDAIGWNPTGSATASAAGIYWYTGTQWKRITDSTGNGAFSPATWDTI